MTSDEKNMLNELAAKIAQAPAPQRDAEAEEIIRTKIGSRPDALYIMTQTVLIQNLALEQSQRQLQELQSRAGQSSSGGSFLGQGASRPAPGSYGGQGSAGYGQAQGYAPPPPQQGGYQQAPAAPAAGGFLRGAAQTAAGVAAGALAFQGIESLMHGFGGGGGGFGGAGFMGGEGRPEETVINNYYDSPQDNRDLAGNDTGYDSQSGDGFLDDASDDGGANDYDDGGGLDDGGGDNYV